MTAIVVRLDGERLREVVMYDPDTGIFRWRIRTGPRAVVGEIAGTIDRKGYRRTYSAKAREIFGEFARPA